MFIMVSSLLGSLSMASFRMAEVELREGGAHSLLLHHLEHLLGKVGPVDGEQRLDLEDLALQVVRGVEHSQRGLGLTHAQVVAATRNYKGNYKVFCLEGMKLIFNQCNLLYLDIIRDINTPDMRESTTATFLLWLERKVASMARDCSRGLDLGLTSFSTTRNFLRTRSAQYMRTSLSVDSYGSLGFSFCATLMQVWLLPVSLFTRPAWISS